MHILLKKDGIEYGPLDQDTLAGAIECVSEVFTDAEPMSRFLGITKEEFLVFANAVYPHIAAQGLSFVARDSKTGKIVGIRISEDFAGSEVDEIPGLSPKFFPLFTILGQIDNHFRNIRDDIVPGKYVHLFMVAVKSEYAGRGIAPNMNKLFFAHVKKLGFTHAVTEPTGAISQHILVNKFGFNIIHEIKYKDFVFEGEKVFAELQGHEGVMLLEKDLSEMP